MAQLVRVPVTQARPFAQPGEGVFRLPQPVKISDSQGSEREQVRAA